MRRLWKTDGSVCRKGSLLKLRAKIGLFAGLLAVLLLLGALFVVRQTVVEEAEDAMVRRVETISQMIARTYLPYYFAGRIKSSDWQGLADSIRAEDDDLLEIHIIVQGDVVARSGFAPPGAARTISRDIVVHDKAWGRVEISYSRAAVARRVRTRFLWLLAAFSAIGALGVAAAFGLARTISGPVARLTEAAARLAAGDRSARARVETSDEVGRLALQFNRMAETIEQAEAALREDVENLSRLHEAARPLAGTLDLEDLKERICDTFALLGRSKKVSLFLRPSLEEETLVLAAGCGIEEKARGMTLPFGEGVAGRAASRGRVERIDDLASDPGYRPFTGSPHDSESMIALPLTDQGRVVGVVTLSARVDGAQYSERDQNLLLALAEMSAVCIQNAQNYNRAITDSLTNLYVKRYFEDRLASEFSRFRRYGSPLSLLMLDLDRFKQINDTYGHPVGDKVLMNLARVIERVIRSGVDIPARYGGEEFAVILVETDADGARLVAERLRKTVEGTPFEGPSGRLPITISVGATTARSGMIPDELVDEADKALYAAKGAGRNRAFHFQDLDG